MKPKINKTFHSKQGSTTGGITLKEMIEKKQKSNKFLCNHDWHITEASNVLQLDNMGYPLRLFICECSKCGKSEQRWIDVSENTLKELDTGESVLLKWRKL